MPPAPLPSNEHERLAALRSYDVLDSVCEAAYDEIAQAAAKLTHCPMAAVSLIDTDRQWFKARLGLQVTETPRSEAFCAYAILGQEPLVVPGARLDPRFADHPAVLPEDGFRFYAGVPLVNGEGYALGTLCVIDRKVRELSAEETNSLLGLARAAMNTLELRRAMRQAQGLAMTDALTGLPNRASFLLALEQAIARGRRHGEMFSLLYIDLDGFKQVNDRFGHAEGDRVLRETARILRTHVRREDDVARLGGDEFALLTGDADAASAGERLCREIATRMQELGWPVTSSIGAVLFEAPPADADSAMSLADQAMYRSKSAGKNQVISQTWT